MFRTPPKKARTKKARTKKAAPAKPKPAKRRARGTGTIFQRSGQWVARVPVGKYPGGATRYVEVRAPTQAACVERMKDVRPPGPDTTVAQWCARWLSGLTVRASTRTGYERQIHARIVPELGHVPVAELTVSQVKAALAVWRAAGTATANRTLAVAANMLSDALLDGLIARNPFADCPKLKYEPKPIDPFAPAELRALIAAHAGKYAVCRAVAFLAGTGARIGEVAALDVTDYHAPTGRVSIARTWSRDHGMRAAKSKHSVRTITVPEPVRPAVLAAIGGRASGVLFPNAGGTRFDSAQFHVGLNLLLKSLGIRRRNPHAIRHGVATLLVSSGVPVGDVAKYLGHTVAQVVRTYVHPAGTEPADALGRALHPGPISGS